MIVRFTKRHRPRKAAGTWKGHAVRVLYHVSPVTGNLFVAGEYDGEKLAAQINRDGAFLVQCDALGRRDRREFRDLLVDVTKYKLKRRVAS